jgi:hypothetical protein
VCHHDVISAERSSLRHSPKASLIPEKVETAPTSPFLYPRLNPKPDPSRPPAAAAEALAHPYFSNAPPPTPRAQLPKPPLREDNPLQVRARSSRRHPCL